MALSKAEAVNLRRTGYVHRGIARDGYAGLMLPVVYTGPGIKSCIALKPKDGSYRCTVYEQRPAQCRSLEPGSDECLKHRKIMGVD